MSEPIDWYTLIATERGAPDGWQWYEIRAVGGPHALVKGAVCKAVFTRGPRKGETNWAKRDRSTEREILITSDELTARKAQYERDTGKCNKCYGSTQEWAGWSSTDGNAYRPCSRCNATGTAPQEMP